MEIHDRDDLARAVDQLIAIEPRFAPIVERNGLPPLRRMPDGVPTLLRIVTDQLISLAAGEAIWNRIGTHVSPLEPDHIIARGEAGLKSLGLSGAKSRTFIVVCVAAREGHFDRNRINNLDDDGARKHLMQIYGIGPWTADIYLLSALGRSDAWPAGDVALQIASEDLFNLQQRPTTRDMNQLASPWRPLRSVAARLLWTHYRTLRRRSPRM